MDQLQGQEQEQEQEQEKEKEWRKPPSSTAPFAESSSAPATTATSSISSIRLVEDEESASGGNTTTTRRLGHLLGLLGYTQIKRGERIMRVDKLYQSVATFLAWKHFNERDGTVLPHLPNRLKGCNFYWTYEARDTALNPMQAVRELISALNDADDDNGRGDQQQPFAIAGPVYSKESRQVSVLGAALEIPQISGTSTSAQLDKTLNTSPLFSRTVPPPDGDAQAAMAYFQSLPVDVSHVGCYYINDAWGYAYQADLNKEANKVGIQLISVPYLATEAEDGTYPDIEAAMETLVQYDLRYYVCLIYSGPWKPVFRAAYQRNIMGRPGYFWTLADTNKFYSPEFSLDRETEADLAQSINGVGVLQLGFQAYQPLDQAIKEFSTNFTLQE